MGEQHVRLRLRVADIIIIGINIPVLVNITHLPVFLRQVVVGRIDILIMQTVTVKIMFQVLQLVPNPHQVVAIITIGIHLFVIASKIRM